MSKDITHEDKDAVVLTTYELGYHLVPSLGEDDLALRVTDIQKAITAEGGSVISEGQPQTFTLAYTMRKMHGGRWDKYDTSFFGWIRFEAPAEAMVVLKDFLDHNEFVIRYLALKLDAAALAPTPVRSVPVLEGGEVAVEPKMLEKKQDEEEQVEVSEEELDKQIEQLIH
jgi:ribosomal protein S6